MRRRISTMGFCLLSLAATHAHCQAAPEVPSVAKPKVYALVSAIGDKFSIVLAKMSTGSHLEPYRRTTEDVGNDVLNRLVLNDLDKAIAGIHPDSKRTYLELPPAQMGGVRPSERESVAIGSVIAALQNMPQRLEWDEIVVATPAYRYMEVDRMASKLEGFGVFVQPLCQSSQEACDRHFRTLDGPEAITPQGKTINASQFVASYSNIEVWVLDAKTLAVIDKERQFENRKIADWKGQIPDMSDKVNKDFLLSQISGVIERSVSDAIKNADLHHPKVEVGEPRIVDPAQDKK